MPATIAQRRAIAAALPFPSDYPALATSEARRCYHASRDANLRDLRWARMRLASHGLTAYHRGWYRAQLVANRRFLANLRAARVALLTVEG